MHYYKNTVGIIIFYNNNSLKKNIKVGIKTMEIWHFFVIFHDFVMKCVYKSTIYTFVIRDKIWTPPLLYKSVHVTFVFWVPKTPPPLTPYMSGTFVLAPPPPPRLLACYTKNQDNIYYTYIMLISLYLQPMYL